MMDRYLPLKLSVILVLTVDKTDLFGMIQCKLPFILYHYVLEVNLEMTLWRETYRNKQSPTEGHRKLVD